MNNMSEAEILLSGVGAKLTFPSKGRELQGTSLRFII
jgi:hypothetical protein